MTTKKPKNMAASVRDRLRVLARERKEELELVLTRYALEWLLFRLSVSSYRHEFVLKGAMLFAVWTGHAHRATRDLDLLGRGPSDIGRLEKVFRDLCDQTVADDGVVFGAKSVRGARIREDQKYEGVRVTLEAHIGTARLSLQVDVGFGDAVIPKPVELLFPVLLDFPEPKLKAYTREAVIAEKFHAMVVLGIANSRMKDLFDIWSLASLFDFEGPVLVESIRATFARRRTVVPEAEPLALTPIFFEDATKAKQWLAFLRRTVAEEKRTLALSDVGVILRAFLLSPLRALQGASELELTWSSSHARWTSSST